MAGSGNIVQIVPSSLMFETVRNCDVIEVRVTGEFARADFLRACAEVRDLAYVSGVLLDFREMTTVPASGRGEGLADELPSLLPRLRIAFVVRPDTAPYGVVHQTMALTTADVRLFEDREAALEWLALVHRVQP